MHTQMSTMDPTWTKNQERSYIKMQSSEINGHPMFTNRRPTKAATTTALGAGWRSPRRVFPNFSDLDEHIRFKIWTRAMLDDGRVFEMRHLDLHIFNNNGTRVDPRKLIAPRALRWTCVESRNFLLKSLKWMDLGGGEQYIVNPDADTIYFGPSSYWFHEICWKPPYINHVPQPWEKRQKWDHWRHGPHNNQPRGQEEVYDKYRERDLTRHWTDPYHPFLADDHYTFERSQIKNVAFDLEFWLETVERRVGGTAHLLSKFPSAKKLILAKGDLGESLDVERIDPGPGAGRTTAQEVRLETKLLDKVRLNTNKTVSYPAVMYTGPIGFVEELAPPRPTTWFGLSPGAHPKPKILCITRGGRFSADPSWLLIPPPVPPGNNDDSDSDSDFDDYDSSDDPDGPGDPDIRGESSRRESFLWLRETQQLYDDQDYMTMQDLDEIREKLSSPDMTEEEIGKRAKALHESSGIRVKHNPPNLTARGFELGKAFQRSEIIREKLSEPFITEEQFLEFSNKFHNSASFRRELNIPNASEKQYLALAKAFYNSVKANRDEDFGDEMDIEAPKENLNAAKEQETAARPKAAPKMKQSVGTMEAESVVDGVDEVLEVLDSGLRYAHLAYRVKWRRQGVSGFIRRSRFRAQNSLELIAQFHANHPDKPNVEAETNNPNPRKAYGSQTKNGQKIGGPARDAAASASSPYAEQQNKSNGNHMDVDVTGCDSDAPLLPVAAKSPIWPFSDHEADKDDETDVEDFIVVDDRSTSATLPDSPPSADHVDQGNDRMGLD